MDNEILYDFKAALAKIIESHSDMKLVISKWREMLDSTARDVEFVFADGDKVVVPNIEKIVQTINERTLPPDPKFNTVTASTQYGSGTLSPGTLKFASRSGGREMSYGINGTQGIATEAIDGARWVSWPIPRYIRVAPNTNPSITIMPELPDRDALHMCDFFVFVPKGSSLSITYVSYGSTQTMQLIAPANESGMWQVCASALYASRTGVSITAKAVNLTASGVSEA